MVEPEKIYSEIQPELERLDEIRLRYYKQVEPFRYLFWSVFILGGSYLFFLINFPQPFILTYTLVYIGLSLILLVFFIWKFLSNKKAYKSRFIHEIAPRIIKCLGPSFSYQSDGEILAKELAQNLLLPTFHRYQCKDFIEGWTQKIHIRFTAVTLKKSSVINHRLSGVVIFKGFLLQAQFQASFPSQTWLAAIPNALVLKNKEDQFFPHHTLGKKYKVYAEHESLSKKILSPIILGKIAQTNEQLQKNHYLRKNGVISLSLLNNTLTIFIPSPKKNMVPGLSKTLDNKTLVVKQLALLRKFQDLLSALDAQLLKAYSQSLNT